MHWVAFAALAVGCSQAAHDEGEAQTKGASVAPLGGQAPSQLRPKLAVVDWNAAAAHPRVPSSELPATLRTTLSASPVPALVPRGKASLVHAKAMRGASWYSVYMPLEGHVVSVSGNHAEVFVPGVSDRVTPRPDFDLLVSRSRGVVTATFKAFGASYAVEVECERPFEDPRCTQDDYVRSLAADLALAGGGA
jgi:hypothetical protein